jgi:hypothetical protein
VILNEAHPEKETCMKRVLLISLLTILSLGATASAQMEMPKVGPEHRKLDYLVGSWTMEGEMKAGPMGPGGKFTETEQNQWMEGGFFLVSHSNFKSSMGNGTAMSVIGYDNSAHLYTFSEFNSMGEADTSSGTIEGDTWTWNGDKKMNGMTTRFVMKVKSPTSYDFKFETSSDGKDWTAMMEGKATKTK